jgi:hypothetical protein
VPLGTGNLASQSLHGSGDGNASPAEETFLRSHRLRQSGWQTLRGSIAETASGA